MPNVDVKTAVNAAVNYLSFLQDNINNELQGVRLEEVELSNDKQYWLVTLGYDIPKRRTSLERIMNTVDQSYEREYKVFKVNSTNSEVESMKIR